MIVSVAESFSKPFFDIHVKNFGSSDELAVNQVKTICDEHLIAYEADWYMKTLVVHLPTLSQLVTCILPKKSESS